MRRGSHRSAFDGSKLRCLERDPRVFQFTLAEESETIREVVSTAPLRGNAFAERWREYPEDGTLPHAITSSKTLKLRASVLSCIG